MASPAVAATCDAYSGTCTTPPVVVPRVVDADEPDEPAGSATEASTLPFTGGELVLMTALGAGAVAGGAALVAAGRRRPASSPE